MTQYWIAATRDNRDRYTIHVCDDIDCLPPDILSNGFDRASSKAQAYQIAMQGVKNLRARGHIVYISANLSEGLFETFKSFRIWGKVQTAISDILGDVANISRARG